MKTKKQNVCPICGQPNYRSREDVITRDVIAAQIIAIKRAGMIPAEGHTDEAFNESLKKVGIDPENVCFSCCTDEDCELLK